jgi:hypothetical protein
MEESRISVGSSDYLGMAEGTGTVPARVGTATGCCPQARRGQDPAAGSDGRGPPCQVMTAMKTALHREPWDWPSPMGRHPAAQMRVKLERVEIMVPHRKFIWPARFDLTLLGALAVMAWIIALLVILLILIAVASKRFWGGLILVIGGLFLLGAVVGRAQDDPGRLAPGPDSDRHGRGALLFPIVATS